MSTTILTNTPDANEPEQSPQAELLVSAVLHLMSHYHGGNDQQTYQATRAHLASSIERHLELLARRTDLKPVLRATCEQLLEHWSALVQKDVAPKSTSHWRNRFFRKTASV
ncbi:hypothetical protein ACO0LB_04485 [Undibacterium sp. SXout7W]|uniref:hypothetical protein n=1 Tax=Undibacterium sp. SXout7W TaxID=3413049 RepID=UPI003BF22136